MTIFAKKKSMTYPNFSSKWKYLVLIIVCAIFLYFFTNYSMLRPSSPNARNKEYFIGLLLICVCALNAFVLHPLLFQKNKTTAYVGYTVISLLAALVVEFTWLYSDIMGCILGNFTQKEAHHYYLGCMFFAFLRDSGLLSFTFLACEFQHSRAREQSTDKLLLESEGNLLVKDTTENLVLLNYKHIRYCEQEQNVTKIYGRADNVYFRYGSLKNFQSLFQNDCFVQISRKVLVASRLIKNYSEGQLWLVDENAPFEVSPSFRNQKWLQPSAQPPAKKTKMPTQGNKFAIDNDKVKTVYRLIARNPEISAVKIMERTHFSQSTVNRILGQLKADGLIEYAGSKKTGGYRVVNR